MKTKYLFLSLAAASMLVGCEDFTEHNFGKAEDLWQPTEVNAYEYTLAASDYASIATNTNNMAQAEAQGLSEELASVATKKALTANIGAAEYLPAILPSLMGSKYYAATAGTTVTLHYTQELTKDSIIKGNGYTKVTASTITKGQYLIVPTGTDSVLTSSKGDGEYGYLYPTAITRLNPTAIATDEVSSASLWNISGKANEWMLQNQADVYAYLDETHASMQFCEDLGDLDDISFAQWSITKNTDGTYAIQNNGNQKVMWFSTQYKSAGSYSEKTDVMLGIDLYKSGTVNDTIQVTYNENADVTFTLEENEETGKLEWNVNGAYLSQTLTDIASTDAEVIYSTYGWSAEYVGSLGDLTYVWSATTSYGIKASAYKNSTNNPADGWMISPSMNLKKAKKPVFTFDQAQKYAGTPINDFLQIYVSTNYAGRGNQASATWEDVTNQVVNAADGSTATAWPDGTSWDYTSCKLDLSKYAGQTNVVVAFRYISNEKAAATWEFKNVLCQEAE